MKKKWLVTGIFCLFLILPGGTACSKDNEEKIPLKGKVVFVSERVGGSALWVMNVGGGDQQQITEVKRRPEGPEGPQWFPDGKKVVFQQSKQVAEDGRYGHFIWIINADGSGLRMLAEGENPQISPDGSKIALRSTKDNLIWVINPDGTNLHSFSRSFSSNGLYFTWLPDGKRIAALNYSTGDLLTINVGGTDLQKTYFMGNCPRWSPDGKKIAFFRKEVFEIWVMDVDGKNVRVLKDEKGRPIRSIDLCWSPDSKWIAFSNPSVSGDELYGQTHNIFVKEVDGDRIYNISKSPGSDSSPSWVK